MSEEAGGAGLGPGVGVLVTESLSTSPGYSDSALSVLMSGTSVTTS